MGVNKVIKRKSERLAGKRWWLQNKKGLIWNVSQPLVGSVEMIIRIAYMCVPYARRNSISIEGTSWDMRSTNVSLDPSLVVSLVGKNIHRKKHWSRILLRNIPTGWRSIKPQRKISALVILLYLILLLYCHLFFGFVLKKDFYKTWIVKKNIKLWLIFVML